MQSDDRITTVMSALRTPRQTFDAAIVSAIDELSTFLADQRAPAHEHVAQEKVRLGSFAAGRIDVERFASIVGRSAAVPPAALDRIAHVVDLLNSFRVQGDRLYRVRVDPGADLRDTVRDALQALQTPVADSASGGTAPKSRAAARGDGPTTDLRCTVPSAGQAPPEAARPLRPSPERCLHRRVATTGARHWRNKPSAWRT